MDNPNYLTTLAKRLRPLLKLTITGGDGGNCDQWIDAYASFDAVGTPYEKEEDGCYLPYGNTLHACAYWRVPAGYSGEICLCPIFILQPGTYGGTLRCSTDVYKGVCGGILSYDSTEAAADPVSPDITDKTVHCATPDPITVTAGDIIKLVMRVYVIDNDDDPFEEDCWFLGWEIKYGACPGE